MRARLGVLSSELASQQFQWVPTRHDGFDTVLEELVSREDHVSCQVRAGGVDLQMCGLM